ncbi:MAG: NAD-dependent epimerase/dehydratase family protein, partial [Bacteroidia bacterium]|nr:NAD-dependent epimerase/dehydratase family protein [Bacteroidia bacterium]
MIIITGAEGFIGSCLVAKLNQAGFNDLVLVDDFGMAIREENIVGKKFSQKVNRTDLEDWIANNHRLVEFVFHIGARTDTTESNEAILK